MDAARDDGPVAAAALPVNTLPKAHPSSQHHDKPSEDTERQAQELAQQIMESMQGLGQDPDSQQDDQVQAPPTEPLTLQATLKKLFINRLHRAAPLVQSFVMTHVRNQLVGLRRIKTLILQGYTPEQLAIPLAHPDRLAYYLNFISSYAAYLCVGVAVAHTLHPLTAVLGSDSNQWPAVDDSTSDEAKKAAQSLKANLDHLVTLPFDSQVSLTAVNYDPLVDFVNKHKAPGAVLDGDIEWEDQGKKSKQRWDNRLSTSLEKLGKTFHDAVQHNQVGCYQKVEAICKQLELGNEGVTYHLFRSLAGFSELPHLTVGPGLEAADEVDLVMENLRLCETAFKFQQQLHTHLLAIADGIFTSSEDTWTIAKDDGRRAFEIYHLIMNDAPLVEIDQPLHRRIPMSSDVAFKAGRLSIFAPAPIDVFRDCFTTAWSRLWTWHRIGSSRLMDPGQPLTTACPRPSTGIVALFQQKIYRMSVYGHKAQDEEEDREQEATILYGPRVNLADSHFPSQAVVAQANKQADLLRECSRAIVFEQAAMAYELWKQETNRVKATAAQPSSNNGDTKPQGLALDDKTNGQAEGRDAKSGISKASSRRTTPAENSAENDSAKVDGKAEVGDHNLSKPTDTAKGQDQVALLNDMLTGLRIGLAGLVDLEPDNVKAKALLKNIDGRQQAETVESGTAGENP